MDAKEVCLSKAAEKIDLSDLAAFLAGENDVPDLGLLRFYFYLEEKFTQVSLQWLNVFKESPLSDVPLTHIPKFVYEISADWIKQLQTDIHSDFVMWALDRILIDWAAHQADAKGAQPTSSKPQVAAFVALAMVLRSKPDALTFILRMLRDRPRYQGEDKLPVIVWMMAQAFQDDFSAALYSWVHNLLPLVGNNKCYSPQSVDLILRFVEMILSNPEAPTILVNEAVREGERLIPPCSFEVLVRLTFPASSARVEATKRFEAIYPLLKEVALAPGRKAMKQIFTFSLKLAGEGNPVLAKEAIAIALCSVTKNVDCFKQWDILYKENIEASVALLKEIVDEWTNHFLKLSCSPNDTLTVNDTIYRFRIKNAIAIDEGVANCFLYKEADKSCKLILVALSRDMVFDTLAAEKAVAEETAMIRFLRWVRFNSGAADETKKAIVSLSEAAAKIDPTDLEAFLCEVVDNHWPIPAKQILILVDYYGKCFSQVSFLWVKMFTESPLSTLIDVPFSQIPISVYEKTVDFINKLRFETLVAFVLWASDLILTEWPGVVKIAQVNSNKSKVATFVVLAIVLRSKPDALITFLPMMMERPSYQGEDKLPVIVWMMAQASQGDLSAGLYSWARNLLPLVVNNKCYSPQSMDLILRFVEMILLNPEAWTILVNEAIREGERLIPPCSFEVLVRLTFPASSARVEATKRFEAIYPLLKEVALAPGSKAMKQIFTFSLKLAGEDNPVLAKEAIAIALCSVTKNVDCFKQWDILYKENIEASVALLKKIVDEWKDHSFKLSSSPIDTSTVNDTIYRFRIKNEEAMTEGVANCFLYLEADFFCQLISGRLSVCRGSTSRSRSRSRSRRSCYRLKKKWKLLKK